MIRSVQQLFAAALLLSPTVALGQEATAPTSWETQKTDHYPSKRDDISFADEQHGWYGTGKGDLYGTTDGGRVWTKIASKPGTFIRALGFIDAKTGFIGNVGTGYYPGVTDTIPLYRTDDGGVTWQPVDLGGKIVAGICAIDVLKTERIFQGHLVPQVTITAAGRVGGPAALVRSIDGGKTWRVTDMSRWTSMILDVHFINERTGYIAGSSSSDVNTTTAQILMTRDGGNAWTEVYRSNRASELIWKLAFPTTTVGYGTVMSYDQSNPHRIIVKTVNEGKTWSELPLVENGKAVELGIGFAGPKHGWIGTTAGGFETTDGGMSFRPVPIAPAANKFRVIGSRPGTVSVYSIGTEVQRLELAH